MSQTKQESPTGERLQKVLAAAGIGSRRQCEELILAGRVTVDQQPVTRLGTRVETETQTVHLDGELVRTEPKHYYILNKPPGVLCTNYDPGGRPRVIDLFDRVSARLFTVGRLDENTRGLLLVTNDGELAHRLAHPKHRVRRVYRATVAGLPTPETLASLREGHRFTEGVFRVQSARRLKTRGKSTILELVLSEGQNREVRRLLARCGHKVIKLERIAFGPLRLGRLSLGESRRLTSAEIIRLRSFLDQLENKSSGHTRRRRISPVTGTKRRALRKKRPSNRPEQRKRR